MEHWIDFMQTVIDGDTYFSADEWADFKEYLSACAKHEKQIVELRSAIENADFYGTCPEFNCEPLEKALAATEDLKDCIICDAVPVFLFRRKGVSKDFCTCDEKRFLELSGMPNQFETKTLYEARTK